MTTSSAGISEQPPVQGLLTVYQVAELLNCNARHVRRLADRGAMPQPLRIGSLVRWCRAEVLSWIEGGCQPVRTAKGTAR